MSAIFDALPGIEVPVGEITRRLASLWEDTAAQGGPAPDSGDVKATQVNFVLHFGYNTTVEDAVEQFRTAVSFSRRAPCRVVVLCPLPIDQVSDEMRAKIYGECHLGKSKGDTRCCEFVLLSYPFAARQYLESQLSVCLIMDLPLYYWVHRFKSVQRLNDYPYLLRRSDRILYDSALDPAEILTFPWPRPEATRDLVYARLLPVRQSIGQFLSSYAPERLADGLKRVRVMRSERMTAEGRVLLAWVHERAVRCGAGEGVAYECVSGGTDGAGLLGLTFEYDNGQHFSWQGDFDHHTASFEAAYGAGKVTMHAAVNLLEADAALSDAMFF